MGVIKSKEAASIKLGKQDGALVFKADNNLEVVVPTAKRCGGLVGENIFVMTVIVKMIIDGLSGENPELTKLYKKYYKKTKKMVQVIRKEKKKK